MKICTKCKIEKPRAEFHRRAASKDGLRPHCKDCQKVYIRAYYQSNRAQIVGKVRKYRRSEVGRITHKKHRQSEKGRAVQRRANRVYQLANPEKKKARDAISSAIQYGKIQRPIFCEECGLPAETQGHHPDYSKPLEVEWLCQDCHTEIHLIAK